MNILSHTNITRRDIFAGIGVAVILIPQSLAYATIAGVPPIYGIYAAIFSTICSSFFQSSPNLQTGPVAITCLLTYGTLTAFSDVGSQDYIVLSAFLALIVGVIRLILGLIRAGFITSLMSEPVIIGFTAASAVIIIFTQIPHVLGVTLNGNTSSLYGLKLLVDPSSWDMLSLSFSIITIFIFLLGNSIHQLFPSVPLSIAIFLIASTLLDYQGNTVGSLDATMVISFADIPYHSLPTLIVPGFVIALVGFADVVAISRNMAKRTYISWNPDRELVSQGVANLASGFAGGIPVGGSFSRTMIGYNLGGRSRWCGLIAGLTVFLFLPFIDVISVLPLSVLSTIIIMSVYKLIDIKAIMELLKTSRAQATITLLTLFSTLVFMPRIDKAVVVGVCASICVHLWRERRIEIYCSYDNDRLVLEPAGVLYFWSAPQLEDELIAQLAHYPQTKILILDLGKVGRIDYTGASILRRIILQAKESGLVVEIRPGKPPQGERLLKQLLPYK